MLSTSELAAMSALVAGGLNGPVVLADITSLSGLCSVAGWGIAAGAPDAGANGSVSYLGAGDLPEASATSTSSTGAALLYGFASPVFISAANADAGPCLPLNASYGLTGQVFVTFGEVSLAPIILP
jgi:hypothetical protein